ncbi:nickel pincer cofactor biosynthesis protein LarC [Faecalicatena contorta]|uniref:nickel pincer cofactor biosynthesis protein LarC n=1 Tax=Faecalicatena contorta TaxID=39482 RepID=UPI00129D2FAC|nr:nickel pincer cofactor biosynthesis protein LarC [Faecalicatena contorta]MRM89846.1 nickel pincer cofactor biosynthesis protein LarC [Faecalicatena contorta]
MSRELYLECASGISGDMFTAALLDLGADQDVLRKALDSLRLPGYRVEISRVTKSGLAACDFSVHLDAEHENHDHDMEYLHGADAGNHVHGAEHSYVHHHSHQHTHEHRGLADIMAVIKQADLSDYARNTAVRIFKILAEAEAKAHGVSIDQVHFHEVGAVDSIVDIVAAAVCLDNLDIKEVIVPILNEGTGFVRCQHGMIPVPVPAVAAIAEKYALTLRIHNMEGEFVTPTGAAIAAAVRTKDRLPEKFTILKTGLGAGKRTYERPSLLRAMLIQAEQDQTDCICKLESNIDDCTGEALSYVMQRLLEAGAKDVYFTPIYMKKNRPAYQINVICAEEDITKLEEVMFMETTTIGIRRMKMERSILKREQKEVVTSLGRATVKICALPSGKRIYPEHDSVAELSRKSGLSWQEVYRLIVRECDGDV